MSILKRALFILLISSYTYASNTIIEDRFQDMTLEINLQNQTDSLQYCTGSYKYSVKDLETSENIEWSSFQITEMLTPFEAKPFTWSKAEYKGKAIVALTATKEISCTALNTYESRLKVAKELLVNNKFDLFDIYMKPLLSADMAQGKYPIIDLRKSKFNPNGEQSLDLAAFFENVGHIESIKTQVFMGQSFSAGETCMNKQALVCGIQFNAKVDPICGGKIVYNSKNSAHCPPVYKTKRDLKCGAVYNTKEGKACGCKTRSADTAKCFNGCPCKTYKSCAHPNFGIKDVKTCTLSDFGIKEYASCRHSSHGIEKNFNSCARKEFGIKSVKSCLVRLNQFNQLETCQ